MKPKVLLTCELMDSVMKTLHQDYDVVHWWELPDQKAYLEQSAAGIKAIVTGGHLGADRDLIGALPDLEIVASYGVGYDKIDLDAAKEAGAAVTNTPDVLTDDVADMVIGLLLCLFRKVHVGDRHVREGKWPQADLPLTRSVKDQTLGVVGLGRIGGAVAKRAEALGMKIAWFDVAEKPVDWPYYGSIIELAKACDVLCMSCNATAENRHMVSTEVLEALGPEGAVVNPARGSLIDEKALIKALKEGKIWGAALDVFEDEPNVPPELFEFPNVVLQPHMGSATFSTRQAMGDLVMENMRRHFAGEELLTRVI